jgi:phosphatidylinositol-4,5-bisphosphate 4-phosphatase
MARGGKGEQILAFYQKKPGNQPNKTEQILKTIKELEEKLKQLEAMDSQLAAATSQKYTKTLSSLKKLVALGGDNVSKVEGMLPQIKNEIENALKRADDAASVTREDDSTTSVTREDDSTTSVPREDDSTTSVTLDDDEDEAFEMDDEADEIEEYNDALEEGIAGSDSLVESSEESEPVKDAIGIKAACVAKVLKRTRLAGNFINSTFATVPATGQIRDVLDTVDDQIRLLQEPVAALTQASDPQDKEVKNVLGSARQMIAKLEARKKYLKDYARNNPFTKKQAYVAKKVDVDAAVLVLESYQAELLNTKTLTEDDKKKVMALQAAKGKLKARLTDIQKEMNSGTADEHVDNPDDLMGPAGPLYEAKNPLTEPLGEGKRLLGKIKEKRPNKPERKQIAEQLTTADLDKVPLASPAITENDVMRKFLVATLKQAGFDGIDSKAVNARQREQHVKARNQQEWNTVQRKFLFRDKDGKQVECDSKVTPASQLGPTFDDLKGGGICSHDVKSCKHATALFKTEVKVGGKTVFAGLRHGINSARGIKEEALAKMPDPELKKMVNEALMCQEFVTTADFKKYLPKDDESNDEISTSKYLNRVVKGLKEDEGFRKKAAKLMKKNANVNRATDMVKAVAVMDPKKLDEAIQSGKMKIQMTSVGLLTPGMGMEGDMIDDQREAWGAINDMKNIPLKVKRKVNKNGNDVVEEVTVMVEVEVNSFNFGVNDVAFSAFGKDTKGLVGWKGEDENVAKPLKTLLGEKSQRGLGGQVGKWVTDAKNNLDQLKQEKPSKNRPQDVLAKEIDELTQEIALVKALAKDVYEMWAGEEYKKTGTAPYKMPARVAVLAQKLGQTPCFNCKSGKDRTSMMDVECKLLSTQLALDGELPPRDPDHDERDRANRGDVAMNSGNFEVQQMNASHMGYKTGKMPGIGGDTAKDTAGTSQQTNPISAD